MRARRILFLNNQGLDQSGGGVTILRHLTERFARENQVTVLAESRLEEDPSGVEQRLLPPPPAPRGALWRFAPLSKARSWREEVPARAPEVDLAVVLDCHASLAMPGLAARRRLYLSLSAMGRMEWFLGGRSARLSRALQYGWLERRAIAVADRCVVSSELHAREIRRFGFLPGFRPSVVPPALPAPTAEGATSAPLLETLSPGTALVLSVARLEPLKGLDLVPRLARLLGDQDAVFAIVGAGPERARLEALVHELGVQERVRIVGEVNDLLPWYRRADVFLHPSRYESFGMAVHEAMQHGVPPICGRPGPRCVVAYPEFLEDRREGRLVDLDDPGAVAAALREWLESPARRRAVGEAARARATGQVAADYAGQIQRLAEALFGGEEGAP